ncbi:Crp/Fnr family transcriptional regulator [Pedobacter sp. MR2016-24]|uniref:Crp/Fnr family transcriptional regulator n=1 Tax=Pedobacter sp. MR2016-24 TaxID=2994466 RepID=UPI00224707EC|nr:Crp/Fnr family transcriptional regulator [Pedobacter sp. MR2016-24]MCX2483853.1 Crp/Fnr family transcriptional regulator [Pedobacter sp. MR2016-24]
MEELQLLKNAMSSVVNMDAEAFNLSLPYWKLKAYKKGEFYNEYHNVCKHLGFIIHGVFRIYRADDDTGVQKNMLFFSKEQFVASYTSFLSQKPCNYYTASVDASVVIYIHIDHLHKLYRESHQWEKFGRFIAETAFHQLMSNTEGFLFKSAEERYLDMMEQHPDIFNTVPLYHLASYLGIQAPSLSRIRKRMVGQ